MVSVPCVTTAPAAPPSIRPEISAASSTRSSTRSSPDAAWRNETADTSATSAISGTSETSASPVKVGSTPLPPESTEEIVPPIEKTVTRGSPTAPPYALVSVTPICLTIVQHRVLRRASRRRGTGGRTRGLVGARGFLYNCFGQTKGEAKGKAGSMAEKEIFCSIGIDIDAVAGWLGSYGGEDSPDDISRGMFSGEVGTPRLLKLFEKYDLQTTWFIPGHSIETFPDQVKMVVDAGHEIGSHGYSHENPVAMTPQQERDVLEKSIELIESVAGRSAGRQRRAVVGGLRHDQRASAGVRLQVRPQPPAPRLHPLLRARWATRGPRSTTPRRPRSG